MIEKKKEEEVGFDLVPLLKKEIYSRSILKSFSTYSLNSVEDPGERELVVSRDWLNFVMKLIMLLSCESIQECKYRVGWPNNRLPHVKSRDARTH